MTHNEKLQLIDELSHDGDLLEESQLIYDAIQYAAQLAREELWRREDCRQMKALSVRQPWAYCIMHEGKDVENRTKPIWKVRGTIIIHAGLQMAKGYANGAVTWFPVERNGIVYDATGVIATDALSFGALVGTVDLIGCTHDAQSPWAYSGMWHWELANPRPFAKPIPYKGRQGFFEVDDVTMALVREQMEVKE